MSFISSSRSSRLAGAAAFAIAFGFAGCGNENASVEAVPTDSSVFADTTPAKATARGLIAAILEHLDPREVKSVGVAEPVNRYTPPPGTELGPDPVSVSLEDGTLIFLSVSELMSGPSPFSCTADNGYDVIVCEDDPYFFIGRVDPESDMAAQMPEYEGRTRGTRSGEVLLQIFTKRSQGQIVDLVRSLLEDENLGMRTTEGLNARGAALEDVQVDRIEGRVELGD